MQQPEPIKTNGAYIADHTSLVDLGNTIQYVGGSILKLREAVDGYFKAVENAMEKKIEEMRNLLEQAKRTLEAAEQALGSCLSRRYYDSEKERWVEPNCSCEERDVQVAEKEVKRIEGIIKKLESIKSQIEREFYEYRRPKGLVMMGGGDSVLAWLGEEHSKSATEKMDEILDKVKAYLSINVRNINSPLSDAEATGMGNDISNNSEVAKAKKFREASQRILNEQNAEIGNRVIHEATAVPLCSKCGRPTPLACICARPGLERDSMYNYDLSR